MSGKISDDEFIQQFRQIGPQALSEVLKVNIRTVFSRRSRIETTRGIVLVPPQGGERNPREYNGGGINLARPHIDVDIDDGVVLVGSDGHYWPGVASTAHRAFVDFCRRLRPFAVVFNGDALDAATISRHPPIGWEDAPGLDDEIACVQERLTELQIASKTKHLYWPLGNHDARFNTRLAQATPEFRGVEGTRLVHHFPAWTPCWSVGFGGAKGAIVKHRYKGGIHAPHNNALWSGRTIVTGHLHSQKVTPLTDYNGTRWGVDTGCLANPWGPQFNYQENNPRNHVSGFAVLTWIKGRLMPPELVTVLDEKDGVVAWRGDILQV